LLLSELAQEWVQLLQAPSQATCSRFTLTTTISSRCLPSLWFQPIYKSPGGPIKSLFPSVFPVFFPFSPSLFQCFGSANISFDGFTFVRWFIFESRRVIMTLKNLKIM
jgi:hypothetical protein